MDFTKAVMLTHFICVLICTFVIFFMPLQGYVDDGKGVNNGQDITRPLTRVDARIEYQKGDNGPQSTAWIATARVEKVLHFSNGWQIGLRADLPYEWYRCSNRSDCLMSIDHFGDSLAQAFLIPPSVGKWTWGYGLKVVFPTAGDNLQIGEGKLQLQPSFAFKYDLNNLSSGSYAGLIVREAFNIAGYPSAPYVSQTYIQPFLNINLPHQWFLTFSPELRYNRRTQKWFVPFDVMLGIMITPRIVLSLEYENAIVYDYKQFTQELEFRIGFFY